MLTLTALVVVVVVVLLVLPLLAQWSPLGGGNDGQRLTSYECGFTNVVEQGRSQLTVGFYIVALLYLVFDLEIALLLPAITVNSFAITTVGLFVVIAILTLGFMYELACKAIDWASQS